MWTLTQQQQTHEVFLPLFLNLFLASCRIMSHSAFICFCWFCAEIHHFPLNPFWLASHRVLHYHFPLIYSPWLPADYTVSNLSICAPWLPACYPVSTVPSSLLDFCRGSCHHSVHLFSWAFRGVSHLHSPFIYSPWLPADCPVSIFPSSLLLDFLRSIMLPLSVNLFSLGFLWCVMSPLSLHLFPCAFCGVSILHSLFIYSPGLSVECHIFTFPSSVPLCFLWRVNAPLSLHLFSWAFCGVSCLHSPFICFPWAFWGLSILHSPFMYSPGLFCGVSCLHSPFIYSLGLLVECHVSTLPSSVLLGLSVECHVSTLPSSVPLGF